VHKTVSSRLDRGVILLNRKVVVASIFVGVIALSMRLLLLLVIPRPEPLIHDEFSYLLAADTFAHGRLTNPTHPMWIHFETFHELSHPTYASKFPPGMGLMLALGQVVFHNPWAAVLISMAVLCGLITWALWAWLPPPWAIAGGLIAALQLTGTYWSESYWGGTLAAIGGALLVGALARLMRRPAAPPALAFGLGLAILANTRPYEGLVLGAACTIFLLIRLKLLVVRGYQSYSGLVRSIGLPIAFVLLPTLIWMGYYNYRVTGNPLLMPYQAYNEQYSCPLPFLWSNNPGPEPKYDHEVFRAFWVAWDAQMEQFARQHIMWVHLKNIKELTVFFLSLPLLFCVLLSLKSLIRNRRLRIPMMLLLLFYLGLALESILLPHYAAPATALVFLIVAAAVQDFSSRFAPGKSRRLATFALICFMVAFEIPRIVYTASHRLDFRDFVLKQLEKEPGQLLVFVRYGPKHFIHAEWVYNAADIDRSRIVWARAMPGGKDEELLRYYPNRRAFILDDDGKLSLEPMNEAARKPPAKILTRPVDKNEDGSHG
jgi:hypothetical protein